MKFVFSENGYNFEPSEIGSIWFRTIKKFKSFSLKRNQNLNYTKLFW